MSKENKNKLGDYSQPASGSLRWTALVMVMAIVISWGVAFVGMKEMLHDAPPFKAAGLRFLVGALPLLVIALRPSRLRRLTRWDFAKFALIGFLQTALMFGIIFQGLKHVPAGASSIILNTNPFFVAILAHWLLKNDRLTRQKVAGLALGFVGVLVLALSGNGFGAMEFYWPLLLFVAAIVWAFSSVLAKLLKLNDMLSATAWQTLFGSILLFLVGFTFEDQPINFTFSFTFWTLFVGLIGSSFAWWAWYRLLQLYNASRVTVFSFFIPVFGVLSGVLLLGESLTINMVFGGALVASGIVIVNLRLAKRKNQPQPALVTEPL
ncbi:MAG TPA: DMT family transporter [Chloroflexia bacterium]|nr:DMT family transporter [Chloroflexia bacterium]